MQTTLRLAALLALSTAARAQCLELGVAPPVIEVGALGSVLAVAGGVGVAGAPGSSIPVDSTGVAYLFDPGSGALLHTLSPTDATLKQGFGHSVATDGSYAAVGAWLDDQAGHHAGAVYLFDVGSGAQLLKVLPPFPADSATFGSTVAITGTHLLVGAVNDPRHAPWGGAVYVFDLATGAYLHELVAPIAQSDLFGAELTAEAGRAVAVAPYSDLSGPDAGAAYLFDVATGALITPLTPSLPATVFGYHASAQGGRVALSATSGRVHLFDLATGAELSVHSVPSEYPDHGLVEVALEADLLLIGQSSFTGAAPFTGRVWAYDLAAGVAQALYADPGGEKNDGFGRALALSGGRGFIGAPGKAAIIGDQGAVFFADPCAPLGTSYCGPAVPNSSGLPARIEGYGSLLVSDQDLVLRAGDVPVGQYGLFLTSATQGFVAAPGGSQGNLCLGGAIGRFTASVAAGSDLGLLLHPVDLTALPTSPPHAVQPGETWNFQAWFRDKNPTPTSNFTDGVAITFQ